MTTFNMTLTVGIKVWDAKGRITADFVEESRSLVKVFLAQLLAEMSALSLSGTHNDVDDNARTRTGTSGNGLTAFRSRGLVSDATEGIVIGTSNTVVDITNTKLVAKIAEGTSSGQMVHAAQTYDTDITIVDPDATFSCNRNFNNNSGGTITVRETGIQCVGTRTVSTAADLLMVRDTPTEVAVPNGGGCNVAYTFQISE